MIPVVIKVCTNFAKILQKNFTNKILLQVMLIQEMMVWLIIGDTLRRPTIILHINNKVITTNVVKCNHVNTKHPCDTIKTINYFSYRIISLFNLVFIYSFSNYGISHLICQMTAIQMVDIFPLGNILVLFFLFLDLYIHNIHCNHNKCNDPMDYRFLWPNIGFLHFG